MTTLFDNGLSLKSKTEPLIAYLNLLFNFVVSGIDVRPDVTVVAASAVNVGAVPLNANTSLLLPVIEASRIFSV